MNIMVIGSGAREHAMVWALKKDSEVSKIICVPGNAGISKVAKCIKGDINNISELYNIAKYEEIDLTIIGPELPLSLGVVNFFNERGMQIFGPCKEVAQLESSKCFSKSFMQRHNIPTSDFKQFEDPIEAKKYIKFIKNTYVVKADGLASGKGVFICHNESEGIDAINKIMMYKNFGGDAGKKIVIEDFLKGKEVSLMVVTDGVNIKLLETSVDYKALRVNNITLNTGGMGAYSPSEIMGGKLSDNILRDIVIPTLDNIYLETGNKYKGVLYLGLMIDEEGMPFVLEYNVRLGDPETQALLVRLESSFLKLCLATINENLNEVDILWKNTPSVCIVAASKGYPNCYDINKEIFGLETFNESFKSVEIFHGGTIFGEEGKILTGGGRVLSIVSIGDSINSAKQLAYEAIRSIYFDGMFYIENIGTI